jgi:hypothetical protein
MKGHRVTAFGRSLPRRGFAGDGDLVVAEARLVADRGPSAALTLKAVAHSDPRRVAFDREVKLPAAAGGTTSHCSGSSGVGTVRRSTAADTHQLNGIGLQRYG